MQNLMGNSHRVLAAGAIIGLAILATGCSQTGTTGAVTADDKVLGADTAPITLIEYASVACPICAHVNEAVMPELKSKYIDTGKVRYVYRPMMTGVPTIASTGHRLAECAGKDKYFQVIDALMSAQKQMYVTGENDRNARPVLLNIAQSLGMSEDAFTKCVTDQAGLKRLNDLNMLYLQRDKIKGTPTFFVNGKEMKMKKGDISDFDSTFAPLLAAK